MAFIKKCISCGTTSSSLFPCGLDCKAGFLCDDCIEKYGFEKFTVEDRVDLQMMELPEIKATVEHAKNMRNIISEFKPTMSIEEYAKFNDKSRQLLVASREFYPSPRSFSLFSYDQIVDFELIENGNTSMSDALDGAIVGGMLFGGAGAVVGSNVMGSSKDCTQLQVKLIVKDYTKPAFYITYIDSSTRTKIGSEEYNRKNKSAHDFLAKLSLIINEAKKNYEKVQADAQFRANIKINQNSVEPTIARIELFLEDACWENASAYADAGLDYFPMDYRLYLLQLCAKEKISNVDKLVERLDSIKDDPLFIKAKRFISDTDVKKYEDLFFPERKEQYNQAKKYIDEKKYELAIKELELIEGYKDADKLIADCKVKQLVAQQEKEIAMAELHVLYDNAVSAFEMASSEEDYIDVMVIFMELGGYRDSEKYVKRIEQILAGDK